MLGRELGVKKAIGKEAPLLHPSWDTLTPTSLAAVI